MWRLERYSAESARPERQYVLCLNDCEFFVLNTDMPLNAQVADLWISEQITISSSVKKNTLPYKLHVVYKSPSGKALQNKRFEAPFTTWFSTDGVFHPEPFRRWLASEVDVLRLAAKENEKTGGAAEVVPPSEDAESSKDSKRRR